MRNLAVLLLAVMLGCGGSTQVQAPSLPFSPPPNPSTEREETVYVGTSEGRILAFAVNEGSGAVRALSGGFAAEDWIGRLRALPDGRHLLMNLGNSRAVWHMPLNAEGGVAGDARQVVDDRSDFEVAPDGGFLFIHRNHFGAEDEHGWLDHRAIISSYRLTVSDSSLLAEQTSQHTIHHCGHLLCNDSFSLAAATVGSTPPTLWGWTQHFARGDVSNTFTPMTIGSRGELSRQNTGSVPDYWLSAHAFAPRWVAASGKSETGYPPAVWVHEYDGSKLSRRAGCNDRFDFRAADHPACREPAAALAIHPGRDLLFVADKSGAIWTFDLLPGDGLELGSARVVVSPVSASAMQLTPSGKFLFVLGDGQLMGFRVRENGSLQPLPGGPWTADQGTTLATGTPRR